MSSDAEDVQITFDQATTELDALQRAAYALADQMTVEIRIRQVPSLVCSLFSRVPTADPEEKGCRHQKRGHRPDIAVAYRQGDRAAEELDLRIRRCRGLASLDFHPSDVYPAGPGQGKWIGSDENAPGAEQALYVAHLGLFLLPLRFHRLDADSILLTNLVGGVCFASTEALACRGGRVLQRPGPAGPAAGEAPHSGAGRTAAGGTAGPQAPYADAATPGFDRLHMFVATLRCEHTCPYCQVSRQSRPRTSYDMSEETARRALDSPSAPRRRT